MMSQSEIFEKYSQPVFSFIYRIVAQREVAMDLTQDTFVKTLNRLDKLNDGAKIKAYLFKTAFNLALNYKRDTRRRISRRDVLKQEMECGGHSGFDPAHALLKIQLRHALDKLSSRQREVLSLRFFADMSLKEIAGIMRISEGTVKVHLARGLNKMKQYLDISERKAIK